MANDEQQGAFADREEVPDAPWKRGTKVFVPNTLIERLGPYPNIQKLVRLRVQSRVRARESRENFETYNGRDASGDAAIHLADAMIAVEQLRIEIYDQIQFDATSKHAMSMGDLLVLETALVQATAAVLTINGDIWRWEAEADALDRELKDRLIEIPLGNWRPPHGVEDR